MNCEDDEIKTKEDALLMLARHEGRMRSLILTMAMEGLHLGMHVDDNVIKLLGFNPLRHMASLTQAVVNAQSAYLTELSNLCKGQVPVEDEWEDTLIG